MTARFTTIFSRLRARRARLALTLALAGCSPPTSPSLGLAPRAPTAEGATYARTVEPGKSLQVIVPLTAAQARGRWHWRLFGLGSADERAEYVSPDGVLMGELRSSRRGDDIVHQRLDAFGTESYRMTVRADGTYQLRYPSGRVSLTGCDRVIVERDGLREHRRCLSVTGAEAADEGGCTRRELVRDARGLIIETACFGPAGPAVDEAGLHRIRTTYDALGSRVEERHEDLLGRPVANLSGCHGRRFAHADSLDLASTTCIDAAGAPVVDGSTGVATIVHESNARGCDVAISYRDERGLPASPHGVARIVREPGPRCELLRQEFHDRAGALVVRDGVAVRTHLVDARGRVSRTSCFNELRYATNCMGSDGHYGSVLTYEYDDRGRLERRRGFLATMAESWTASHVPHLTEWTYDDQGRERLVRYYNEWSRPIEAPSRGQEVHSYEPSGDLASIAAFRWDGAPAKSNTGCHVVRFSHDALGRRTRIECVTDSEPGTLGPSIGSVSWPVGARAVEILREPHLINVFRDHDGREVKRVDCAEPGASCHG